MENSKLHHLVRPARWTILTWLLCLCLPCTTMAQEFIAVAYHDIVDHRSQLTYDALTVDNLIDHFEWLKANGYHPISIDDLLAARSGTKPLPDKAILLCWDDAYTSFYTHVLPLLKAYHYPAVLALVGSWMSPNSDEMVQYGNKLVPRNKFMTWEQVKKAAASGLVEIASHSNKLHTAVLADRYGDKLPAASARIYDPATSAYETTPQYERRIYSDLQAGSDLMLQHLGFRPRVLVWPFGRYNATTLKLAAQAGMPTTLTLNPVPANTDQPQAINRFYPTSNPDLMQFRSDIKSNIQPPVNHFFRVNSQDLLEPRENKEEHFSLFLDRVKDLDPNTVVIDPVVEDQGIRKALFINSRFPLAQDRLNRLSWHTSKRGGADVFLWLSSPLFVRSPGETEDSVEQFFYDMGKSSPGKGLVIDRPEMIQALLDRQQSIADPQEKLGYWNPDRQRSARQALIRDGGSPQILSVFKALEAFQQWQPFQDIVAVLSIDQFRTMEIRQIRTLLHFFDFLLIQGTESELRSADNLFGQQLNALRSTNYIHKCSFLLTDIQPDSLPQTLHNLPTMNIINWGYQYDQFLQGIPEADSVRPLLSKRGFPYPLRH